MGVNKELPHVFVLPEDDANRQLAEAFHKDVDWTQYRQMQVLVEAGGWRVVVDLFKSEHITEMDRNAKRLMVLLIDFDGHLDRLDFVKRNIPIRMADRVFVLGAFRKPEALKPTLGSYETIGMSLAKDCRQETDTTWNHPLVRHNATELDRLREHVRPILF